MNLLDTAISYHKAGLCILPAYNNEKFNHFWQNYKEKRPTLEQVQKWFGDEKATGILVICGKISGITVVDDDNYKKGKPLDLHSPLEAKTGSGGRHIYFKYSPEIVNRNMKTEENDFEIQNDGKLIVMPPSMVMNKQGKVAQYEWLVREQGNINLLPTLSPEFTAKYEANKIQKIEMTELLSVDYGQQHNYLRTLINKLLAQTDERVWESDVKPVIVAAANKYNPPHPPERIEKLWMSCKEFIKQKRQEKLMPLNLSQVASARRKELELEKDAPSTGFSELDKLLKGFIPGRLYLVSGDTNVGKTSISANFAVNLANQNRKVLYFALEPANTVIDYLTTVAFDTTYDKMTDFYTNENVTVYTKEQITDLKQMCELVKELPRQDLIIVDHIGYFTTTTNGNTNEAQSNTIKTLVQLAKKKKSAIMLIAHMRKGLSNIPKIDDISGSGALKQDATDVLIVVKDKVEDDEYENLYKNDGAIIVSKTKSGPNGYMKIKFKERSAKIYEKNWKPAF